MCVFAGGWGGGKELRSNGRSGQQKGATRRNMRREDWVTVQGPVKKQQSDGTSHGGWGGYGLAMNGRRLVGTQWQVLVSRCWPGSMCPAVGWAFC